MYEVHFRLQVIFFANVHVRKTTKSNKQTRTKPSNNTAFLSGNTSIKIIILGKQLKH